MAVYEFIQNDTTPMEATISDAVGKVRLDAPGTAVFFTMEKVDSDLVVTGQCEIVDDGSTAQRGKVIYHWGPDETSAPGVYRAQFRYVAPTGAVKHFPNSGHEDVIVHPQVGA